MKDSDMADKDPRENLVPFTQDNAKSNGRKGGLKSAEARKKKKNLSTCLKTILELPPTENYQRSLKAFGIEDDEMSNQMVLAVSVFRKAVKGDVRAAEYIRDITGQQPLNKLEKARARLAEAQAKQIMESGKIDGGLSKIDELLQRIDEIAGEPEDEVE